jgi:5-methyltetrahydropteroyltriglutamate--homocysteine methyltransferase
VRQALAVQQAAGVDIVSDGEQRRDNFYSFIAGKVDGVRLMSLAAMLDYVEDKAAFERLLNALDVPAFAIKNPVVVGKLRRRQPLASEDYLFLRQHTDKPIKATLPSPCLLTRSMWVKSLSAEFYPTKLRLRHVCRPPHELHGRCGTQIAGDTSSGAGAAGRCGVKPAFRRVV